MAVGLRTRMMPLSERQKKCNDISRVPAPKVLKNSRFFKAFSFNNSRPIQGPSSSQSFYSIQPYWYSRKKTPI